MGLNDKEVLELRKKYGSNEITRKKSNTFFKILLESLSDPIIKILLIALSIKIVFLFKNFDWYETLGIVIAIFLASFISSISEYGSNKDSFCTAAKKVYEYMHPDIIDINMGCPVPKIAIKSQAGSALLKNPEKIYEIVKAVKESVPCPITVKIRSGWDKNSINCIEVAKICEKASASAITLHARTRSQGYSGHSDWSLIKKVKESVNIPVIGNGDVTSCYEAKKMLLETGCDLVMIGRGLLGNPWLIKECNDYLNEGKLPKKVTYEEKIEMMKRHLTGLVNEKGEKSAVLEIRTHFLYYLKGLEGSSEIKNLICKETSYENIIKILDNYLIQLENNK